MINNLILNMGKVGFGAYRVSVRSKEHYESLSRALQNGLSLIDTSANYTDGESEELIGKVLAENPEFKPIIVTKAGYIQGKNLIDIPTEIELVIVSESLKHSIHPIFLEAQLTKSLSRLGREFVDVFLLHNPEYYFKSDGANNFEFYQRIEKAFQYLETEVIRGRIKSYGISSNHFILPHNDPEFVSLTTIIEIAKKNSVKNNFTHIQFPMNLIEIGALEKYGEFGDSSLIDIAKSNGLITMANRPLNAFTNGQFIRLATYENIVNSLNDELANEKFSQCMNLLNAKWVLEHSNDQESDVEKLEEVLIVKQFKEMWNMLPTPDSVDQVYQGHFFPFVAQLYGGSLTPEESIPFYDLYEFSKLYSRKVMDTKARSFRAQAIHLGLIDDRNDSSFAKEAIETYLDYGIDYVLVGMKKIEYVEQLKEMF